jgi:hypothetical protein
MSSKAFNVVGSTPVGQSITDFDCVKKGDWLVSALSEGEQTRVMAHRIIDKTAKRIAIITGCATLKKVLLERRRLRHPDDVMKSSMGFGNKSQGLSFFKFITQEQLETLMA